LIKTVGIVAKRRLVEAARVLSEIAAWLRARHVEPVFDRETAALASLTERDTRITTTDELPVHVDLCVVLGGDGTLLGMADRIAHAGRSIPILGVNFGGLGFLTEVTLPELYNSLEATLAERARIDERMMLRSIVRGGDVVRATRVVVNDVVVTKGALARIIDLSVWVGDEFVTRFKSDGLIVSSPTGSTAYNLAAAGPIVHPHVDAMVITPIAPHTLTNRPLVIPAGSDVRIQPSPNGADAEIFASFDGQFNMALGADDIVTVGRAEQPLRLVRAATRSYFEVLREKLKWGQR
jgi:NAD+ kinase